MMVINGKIYVRKQALERNKGKCLSYVWGAILQNNCSYLFHDI